MLYIFLSTFTVFFGIAKYYDVFNYYKILKNDVLQMKNQNDLFVLIELLKYIFIYIKFRLFPKIPLQRFNKKYLKIPYEHHGKKYYYLLKSKNNSQPIKYIKNQDEIDVTDTILPYLGPHLDCHGAILYPKDFGYSSIKIETMYDQEFVFESEQEICLN
jgi:hypothetical protein